MTLVIHVLYMPRFITWEYQTCCGVYLKLYLFSYLLKLFIFYHVYF